MTHYKMLLVELYIELMTRSCERERFSYYARMGTLMERYRETRDESLIKQFRSIFEKELKARGLWECDDSDDETLTRPKIGNQTYSRFDHFEDCIRTYQGRNQLNVSVRDIKEIKDYFNENYDEDHIITRRDLERTCSVLDKDVKTNEINALLLSIDPRSVDDISHLEEDLMNDFRSFSREYDSLVREGMVSRKFMYMQSVLYHLLKRRGHSFRIENFMLIKNKQTLKKHGDICRLLFERLGWSI